MTKAIMLKLTRHRRRQNTGFTLIEIMFVVAIMALVLAVGIPSMFRMAERDSIRKVVNDIIDACAMTRAQAILSGEPKDLVIQPGDRVINAPGKEAVIIPERITIEVLGVNFVELTDAPEARVRFYPNGTSDEFTIVLRSDKGEWRKISLDVITALTRIETDETKFGNLY